LGPGFDVDEPIESLGEALALPPNYQHLREELEKQLTPLPDPRAEALSR
jgi:glyoxalase family protein